MSSMRYLKKNLREIELWNLRALKMSTLDTMHIFKKLQYILFCLEIQRIPLQFQAKYLTHRYIERYAHTTGVLGEQY